MQPCSDSFVHDAGGTHVTSLGTAESRGKLVAPPQTQSNSLPALLLAGRSTLPKHHTCCSEATFSHLACCCAATVFFSGVRLIDVLPVTLHYATLNFQSYVGAAVCGAPRFASQWKARKERASGSGVVKSLQNCFTTTLSPASYSCTGAACASSTRCSHRV